MLLIGAGFVALIGRVAYLQTYGRQQTIERTTASSIRPKSSARRAEASSTPTAC